MEISTEQWNSWKIIAMQGKFVLKNSSEIRKALESELDAVHPQIAVDLSKVSHLDSSGLSLLVSIQNQIKEKKGNFVLFGANRDLAEIMNIVGFDHLAPHYADRSEFETKACL